MSQNKPSIISLFSGALGLDLGLEKAGFRIAVAVENNRYAAETIRLNRPKISVIEKDIQKVTSKEILESANLKVGEVTLVSAGPSCQTFSTAGSRGSFEDPRGVLFREFLRVVRDTKPRFFVMENVPGMLSAAVRHRPLKERGHGFQPLSEEEEHGAAFGRILKELKKTGYYVVFDVLNSADYGAPQSRKRVIFIGSRNGELVKIPTATHSGENVKGKKRWQTLQAAIGRLDEGEAEFVKLTPKARKYLEFVPEGGNWRDLPPQKRWRAMGKAYQSWGGRVGFYRRLSWNKPSPSLTTSPVCRATMLCHPTLLRPLSVQEYMAIQQFPKRWKFAGSTAQKYKQIGNAVPIGLGRAIGKAIVSIMAQRKKTSVRGVVCENSDLLRRLEERPRTTLNPSRMRKVKNAELTAKWVNHRVRRKHIFLKHLTTNPVKVKKRETGNGRKAA